MKQEPIKCPSCSHELNVDEIMYSQLSEKIKTEFWKKTADEKKELEIKLRKEIYEEKNEQMALYRQELEQKSLEVKELNKTKAELEKTKREKSELREQIEAESELKITNLLNTEKDRIRTELESRSDLKLAEKEHIIEQLKKQLKDASRKAEQGSMQIQGEVQEEAIELYLRTNFPLDEIEEIKKGARGADCLQVVNTRTRQNCGSIYYESKNTKEFQNSWIEKFKADMRTRGADVGIIVTDAFPKDMTRMGQKDGIWICSMEEFKALCFVLRETILLVSHATNIQQNKGDKMSLLYDFLTGNEFRQQVEAIVEGFSQMNTDLSSEKRAMEGIWKKREKQIQKVVLNTTHMYSSIKGIAGDSVSPIAVLELNEVNAA